MLDNMDDRKLAALLFFSSLLFYLLNIDFLSTGDTIYYANIIDNTNFGKLTAHQLYYFMGYVFAGVLDALFGMATDHALAVMSTFFGAACLSVAYLFLRCYLERREALLAVLFLFLCHRFFENSISAEIYIVQSFMIWASYLAFEKKSYYLSGLMFTLALWVTPLSIMFGFWFLLACVLDKRGIRPLLQMAVPGVLIYVPFLALFYEELLWGNRGLINEDSSRTIDLVTGLTNFVVYQAKHYGVLNLLLLPALLGIAREKRMFLLTLAVLLPNIYTISQLTSEDNVFILAADVFFAYWILIGWRELAGRVHVAVPAVLVAAQVLVFIATEQPFVRPDNIGYQQEMRNIGQMLKDDPGAVLVTDWTRHMALVYYNREESYEPLEDGYWFDKGFDLGFIYIHGTRPSWFDKYDTIYFLESWGNSRHAQLLLSDEQLAQRYRQNGRKRRIEEFLDTECEFVSEDIHKLFRCR